jgi:hypothetical protein
MTLRRVRSSFLRSRSYRRGARGINRDSRVYQCRGKTWQELLASE